MLFITKISAAAQQGSPSLGSPNSPSSLRTLETAAAEAASNQAPGEPRAEAPDQPADGDNGIKDITRLGTSRILNICIEKSPLSRDAQLLAQNPDLPVLVRWVLSNKPLIHNTANTIAQVGLSNLLPFEHYPTLDYLISPHQPVSAIPLGIVTFFVMHKYSSQIMPQLLQAPLAALDNSSVNGLAPLAAQFAGSYVIGQGIEAGINPTANPSYAAITSSTIHHVLAEKLDENATLLGIPTRYWTSAATNATMGAIQRSKLPVLYAQNNGAPTSITAPEQTTFLSPNTARTFNLKEMGKEAAIGAGAELLTDVFFTTAKTLGYSEEINKKHETLHWTVRTVASILVFKATKPKPLLELTIY